MSGNVRKTGASSIESTTLEQVWVHARFGVERMDGRRPQTPAIGAGTPIGRRAAVRVVGGALTSKPRGKL